MNLEEFLKELAEIKDKFLWRINEGGIRGTLKERKCDCCNQCFCPITAVARQKFFLAYPQLAWKEASEKLKMEINTARMIVAAADEQGYEDVRSKLLQITIKDWSVAP